MGSIPLLARPVHARSLKPKPVPVQGEAKFSLRCRIWELSGVTNSEERNIGAINITQVRCVCYTPTRGGPGRRSHAGVALPPPPLDASHTEPASNLSQTLLTYAA